MPKLSPLPQWLPATLLPRQGQLWLSIAYANQIAVPYVWSLLTSTTNSKQLWLHSMIRSQVSATAAGCLNISSGERHQGDYILGGASVFPSMLAMKIETWWSFSNIHLSNGSTWREKLSIRQLHKSIRSTLAPFSHISGFFSASYILLTELLLSRSLHSLHFPGCMYHCNQL